MKNVIIIGSSGMVGSLVLKNCLKSTEVAKVTTVVRQPTGVQHPKLTEVVHSNFLDLRGIIEHLRNLDICFYCAGVYTGAVSREMFREITVDYTREFAETMRLHNDGLTFCFLSGQGADIKGKSKIMFARDKGAAEAMLIRLNFYKTFIFRPGYIYPTIRRKEPNMGYRLMRLLYKPLSRIYPGIGITSDQLAEVMVKVGLGEGDKIIYEHAEIRELICS